MHEDEPRGTAGALGLLPDDMPALPLLVVNGDLLTDINIESLIRFHTEQDGMATLCVKEYDLQVPFGVVESEGTRVVTIREKPAYKFFVSAGMYVLEPETINRARDHSYLDMPDLLDECIQANETVRMFPIHERWRDIGRMEDYQEALRETGT